MKRWTKEEDARLVELISENVGNLQKAFRLFSAEYPNRTVEAASYRWYAILRLDNNVRVCFVTVGKKAKHANRKIVNTVKRKDSITKTLWNKLLKLLSLS